jgi:hypothetical protein
MAPVAKRLTISEAGSTSSMGTGARPTSEAGRSCNNPRKVANRWDWSSTARLYSLKIP